jgi:DNA-binding CsgD family transcriptional regulator
VISGYSIDEFYSKGYLLLIECMHPDERNVMMLRVLPELVNYVATVPDEEKKSCQSQFNCRFKRKSGEYINLLAQSYVLEVDQKGRVALALSSIIQLETREILPLRWSTRLIKNNGISETAFIKTHNTSIDLIEKITPRELDVLRNLAAGKTSKLIGKELSISHHTVDTHRRRLLKKLNCKTVVDLARFTYRNGLI